ncbi:DUF3579 domain-containing protein [Streptococcus sp. S784/96/1]|uniref:DUF3579 domain-containing protein n=1 Tax=Streptococcus sp. S784/96/1 TaxID=2653499 RepID=UPI0013875953|nr:DUF3579 domain-containing protein [Streptococcus sp. S784/96/1]
MANIAEKVVRVEPDVYEFVVDFANEHDLKISEAASILLRFCKEKDFEVVQRECTIIEKRPFAEEVNHGRNQVD